MRTIHFPNWPEVLAASPLPGHLKHSYEITIRWYLGFCRRGRSEVHGQSARDFIAWATEQKHPQAWQLEDWKEAIRWFFLAAKEQSAIDVAPEGGVWLPEASQGWPEWKMAFLTTLRRRKYSYRTEQSYQLRSNPVFMALRAAERSWEEESMNSHDQGGSGDPASRQREVGESDAEHAFWCRYWEVLRSKGVPSGREVWYERACLRFIRELKPRRLKQAQPEDVTQFLGLLAQQAESAAWKIRQADEALRIVFQEMVRCAWAEQWPVGLPELDGWMEGPEGGGKMPVPADSAQARFAEQVNKMVSSLRCRCDAQPVGFRVIPCVSGVQVLFRGALNRR